MSVNAPSRIHYSVSPNGDDDLFYQIDGSHFRLYEKEKDSPPIYVKPPIGNEMGKQADEYPDDAMGEPSQPTEFAYESDLRDFFGKKPNDY